MSKMSTDIYSNAVSFSNSSMYLCHAIFRHIYIFNFCSTGDLKILLSMRNTKDIFCTVVVIESTFMIDSQVHLSVLDYHKVLDGET